MTCEVVYEPSFLFEGRMPVVIRGERRRGVFVHTRKRIDGTYHAVKVKKERYRLVN